MIIPADTSGAAISTGQGQGYAQVLGQSSFDPVVFADTIRRENEGRAKQRVAQEIEKRQNNKKYLLDLPIEKNINDYNRDLILGAYKTAEDQVANWMAQGLDLENSVEGQKLKRDLSLELTNLGQKGKYIADTIADYREMASQNPEKYDNRELNDFTRGLSKIKGDNAAKTLDMQLKYIEENAPFTEPGLDILDVLTDINSVIPEITKQAAPGAPMITKRNKDNVKELVEGYYQGLYTDDPNNLTELVDKGVRQGLWEDYQGMIDYSTDEMMKRGKEKEDYPEGRSGKGGGISIGGYRTPENITVEGKSRWGTSNGNVDEISIAYNGKDVPPFEVEKNQGGEKIKFAPVKWFKDQNGNWMVEGKSYGRTGEEKIKPASFKTMGDFFNDEQKKNPDAEIIVDGDKLTIFKPLKTEIVPYDLNDISFKSHLNGFDLYQYEQGWNKSKAKAGATTKFKGVPQGGF